MLTEQMSRAPEPKKSEPTAQQDLVNGAEQAVENEKAARESGEESPA